MDIISRIAASHNSKSAWIKLLLYVPAILSKPRRSGAKKNLSNIINKRTANWDEDHPQDLIPLVTNNNHQHKNKNEDQDFAMTVHSKLEVSKLKEDPNLVQ